MSDSETVEVALSEKFLNIHKMLLACPDDQSHSGVIGSEPVIVNDGTKTLHGYSLIRPEVIDTDEEEAEVTKGYFLVILCDYEEGANGDYDPKPIAKLFEWVDASYNDPIYLTGHTKKFGEGQYGAVEICMFCREVSLEYFMANCKEYTRPLLFCLDIFSDD